MGLYVMVILIIIFTPKDVNKVRIVHYTFNVVYNNFESPPIDGAVCTRGK